MKEKRPNTLIIFIITCAILLIGFGLAMKFMHPSSSASTAVNQTLSSAEGSPAQVFPVTTKPPGVVYEAKFDELGPEWSTGQISTTPIGDKKFIGPYLKGPVLLTVEGLPLHQFIRVTFSLVTYNRWNGDHQYFGRDAWDMRVLDGQPLIHTTFSNCGFFSNNNDQSFPDQYPWYPTHLGWTGAAARQSLGWTTSQGQDRWGDDSTYAFDLTFPHDDDKITLEFSSFIKNHEDKAFGFLSFKIETVDHAAQLNQATMDALWKDLADEDPVKAYHAVWALVAAGDKAAQYISIHLPSAPPAGSTVPLNIDQKSVFSPDSFEIDTPGERLRARAIHVLEAINSNAATTKLKEIGYEGTPNSVPPTGRNR